MGQSSSKKKQQSQPAPSATQPLPDNKPTVVEPEKIEEESSLDEGLYEQLIETIRAGDLEALKAGLLDSDMDINQIGPEGETFLVTAVECENIEIVRWFLEQPDIDVNLSSEEEVADEKTGETVYVGRPPLTAALKNKRLEIFNVLLGRPDIDVNARDQRNGDTALNLAAYKGYVTKAILLLKHKNTDVNKAGTGPLDTYTPLMAAVTQGNLNIAAHLLKHSKIKMNQCDAKRHTALNYAIQQKNIKAINLLRYYGANRLTNSLSVENFSAMLQINPQLGLEEIHQALIKGASHNLTALLDEEVTRLFEEYISSSSQFTGSLLSYLKNIFNLSLWAKLLPPAQAFYLNTALLRVAYEGKVPMMDLLLQKGSDPNAQIPNFENSENNGESRTIGLMNSGLCQHTPLTALIKNPELTPEQVAQGIAVLIQNGASIEVKNGQKQTPLEFATAKQNIHAVEKLLEYNPKIEKALKIAEEQGCPEIHRLLLEAFSKQYANADQETKACIEKNIIKRMNVENLGIEYVFSELKVIDEPKKHDQPGVMVEVAPLSESESKQALSPEPKQAVFLEPKGPSPEPNTDADAGAPISKKPEPLLLSASSASLAHPKPNTLVSLAQDSPGKAQENAPVCSPFAENANAHAPGIAEPVRANIKP